MEACPEGALKLTPEGICSTGRPCRVCGACADACPALAMEICGREWPLEELMAEVEKERGVMTDSGGGVTLSGGEPLLHPEYTLELLAELGRRGFHRLIAEVNASEANLAATATFLTSLDRQPDEVDLLPYHDIGKGKHERLGTTYNPEALSLTAPSKEDQAHCLAQLESAGLTVKIGG